MQIRPGELDHPEVIALLREHLRGMAELSPAESMHALDLDGLKGERISFWSAWDGEDLLGCGALQQLDDEHGEIKSMRTADAHRRRGVAAAMLEHLIGEAARRDYRRLSLETGSMEGFESARRLYARYGFDYCGPFADYREDPNSVFMSKAL